VVEDLMYIQTSVNEQPINVMLDSGVTHIFVSNQLVKDLGLRLSSNRNFMKAINPKA
jgi:predicted aspartyl protease